MYKIEPTENFRAEVKDPELVGLVYSLAPGMHDWPRLRGVIS